jgi:hypothetical protein
MDDREDRIRRRAHQIWEEEGHPDGQEAEHWKRAVREIDGDTGRRDRPEGEQSTPLSTRRGNSIVSGMKPSDGASTAEAPYSDLRRG